MLLTLSVASTVAIHAQEPTEVELEAVRSRIAGLEERLQRDARRRDDGIAELRRIELEIAEKAAVIERLDAEIATQQQRETDIRASTTAVESRLRSDEVLLAEQIRLSFRTGRQEMFKLLLSQERPVDLGRMLTYYDYLNRARGEQIDAAHAELDELAVLGAESRAVRSELVRLRDARQVELDDLAAAGDERLAFIDSLEAAMGDSGDEIGRLRAEEERLVELLEQLAELLDGFPVESEAPFETLRGQLAWPLEGTVAEDFGDLREGGPLRWNGVVIGAASGTPVRAIYHGRVAFADWLPGLGLLLILDHGGDYLSLYGHNGSLLREPGDWVRPGEVIAEVGDTGGRREPALYFEIRHAGKPENPHDWIE